MQRVICFIIFSCLITLTACQAAEKPGPLSYSLTLDQAIDYALKENRTYDNAKMSIKSAELSYRAVQKEWLPKFTTNYSYDRTFSDLTFSASAPDINDPNLMDTYSISFPQDNYMWTTWFSMPLFSASLDTQVTIARLGIDVAKVRLIQAKNELVANIKLYYYTVLRDQRFIEFLYQNLKSYEELERLNDQYHRQGLVAMNSVLEARVEKANAEQELANSIRNADVSLATLKTAMSMDITRNITIEDMPEKAVFDLTFLQCIEAAKKQNPELIAFQFLKSQGELAVKLEKTEYTPSLNLSAYYMTYGDTPGMQPVPGIPGSLLTGMLSLNWMFFDWGKKADEAKIKQVELDQLRNNEKLTYDRVVLRIKEAYSQLRTAERNMETAKIAIVSARENLRISKLRYQQQVAPQKEVIDALTNLKRAEYNYQSAFYAYHIAVAGLDQAMGKDTARIIESQKGDVRK
ncbi:MAG: TolC family protein [Candidatus Eremiobacteraeota bacterium]|nr:TolC family protein [Candidatus Eremiobacteraeota bacterium]